jgi:hypothetical protein
MKLSTGGYSMSSKPFIADAAGAEDSGMDRGRPENVTPWQRQPSANSGKSPRSRKPITEELKKLLAEIVVEARDGRPAKTGARVLAERMLALALADGPGSLAAVKLITDRVDGAVPRNESVDENPNVVVLVDIPGPVR